MTDYIQEKAKRKEVIKELTRNLYPAGLRQHMEEALKDEKVGTTFSGFISALTSMAVTLQNAADILEAGEAKLKNEHGEKYLSPSERKGLRETTAAQANTETGGTISGYVKSNRQCIGCKSPDHFYFALVKGEIRRVCPEKVVHTEEFRKQEIEEKERFKKYLLSKNIEIYNRDHKSNKLVAHAVTEMAENLSNLQAKVDTLVTQMQEKNEKIVSMKVETRKEDNENRPEIRWSDSDRPVYSNRVGLDKSSLLEREMRFLDTEPIVPCGEADINIHELVESYLVADSESKVRKIRILDTQQIFTADLDSGARFCFLGRRHMVEYLGREGDLGRVKKLKRPVRIRCANNRIESARFVMLWDLSIEFEDKASVTLKNVPFFVVDADWANVLIGQDVLFQLGLMPEQNMSKVVGKTFDMKGCRLLKLCKG